MGLWSKIRAWMTPKDEPLSPPITDAAEVEVIEEQKTEVTPLSEEEQQLLQIKELLASPDISNHELAAMFLLGLNYNWDQEMYQLVLGQANKLTFWVNQEENDGFLQGIRMLRIGPQFFAQYSDIADFAAALPRLVYVEELYWDAKHYWNQHPILVAASQLPALKVLHCCNCKMNYLPNALAHASQLEELYLSGNKLTELPENLEQLTSLQVLDLSENLFKRYPRSISSLRQLEILRLHKNPINSIEPRLLGRLYRLQDLQLPELAAKFNLDAFKDWLPDVDFEKSYWNFDEMD